MTCREVEKLLDLFLDGELDARPMRTVALHVTRCAPCEGALQRVERVQEVVAETFADAVGEVDFSGFWPGVAARLGPVRASARWRARLEGPGVRLLFGVAAAMLIALLGLAGARGVASRGGEPAANNQVRIDALRSEARSVALLSEPASNTTVIWVVDEGPTP